MEAFTNAFNYMADDSGCISKEELIVLMNSLCDPGTSETEITEILGSLEYETIDLNLFLDTISFWLSE